MDCGRSISMELLEVPRSRFYIDIKSIYIYAIICLCALSITSGATFAFEFNDIDRWSSTATDGGGLGQGDPTTITWSFVPDGTTIFGAVGEPTSPSDLISTLDSLMDPSSTGGSDLTQRAWFNIFNASFERFTEISGLTLVYEPNDTTSPIDGTSSPTGQLGVRGDVRIGGHSIDGQTGSNTLAYNYFPNHGDMVLDTDNEAVYDSNSKRFRNVIMHEHGHGLGLEHTIPVDQTKLLEPFISTQFEGPQIDDILALHRGYGDFYEKSNSGAGNEVFSNAVFLGTLSPGDTESIGTDANEFGADFEVFPNEDDFISIDDNSDVDFLSFTIDAPSFVDITLTPVGGDPYNTGPEGGTASLFDPTALSDLTLSLFDTNGIDLIDAVNSNGLGGAETLTDQVLDAGTYYARVTGAQNTVQLYQLDVTANPQVFVPEDLNMDGFVDGLDLGILLDSWLSNVSPELGELNGTPPVDGLDLGLLLSAWDPPPFAATVFTSIPEPASLFLCVCSLICFSRREFHK